MNKKTLILVLIGLMIAVSLLFVGGKTAFSPTATSTPTTNTENGIDFQIPEQTLPLSNAPKDVAWALFQKYLRYNKDQNLEGVRSVVYKVAPVCEDVKTTIDCQGRMGAAYAYGSALKKEDFTNVWSDENQIILASDFQIQEDETAIRRSRAIIYFLKSQDSSLKLLSFSPSKGATAGKGTASKEELNDRIIRYTEDKDNDGLADYNEECLATTDGQACNKTNPKVRDTDGNGIWDGLQALMN